MGCDASKESAMDHWHVVMPVSESSLAQAQAQALAESTRLMVNALA